jgi:hypothetical protein
MIKDWLIKGAHGSLLSTPRNVGNVILLDGRKVAVSRDATGENHVVLCRLPALGLHRGLEQR